MKNTKERGRKEMLSLREILSNYSVSQLNHLVGTRWGIRFRGKDNGVDFYLEKLTMNCHMKNVLRKLSDDEIELLRFLAIRSDPTDEDTIKTLLFENKNGNFFTSIASLMALFMVYSTNGVYYIPEELVESVKRVLGVVEQAAVTYCDNDIAKSISGGNFVYDLTAILWSASRGIELTQMGDMQKTSMERIISRISSGDADAEAKVRMYTGYLESTGALIRRNKTLVLSVERALALLDEENPGEEFVKMRRVMVKTGDAPVSKSLKGVHEFYEGLIGLKRGVWYDLERTINNLVSEGIKSGIKDKWVSLPIEDLMDMIVLLSWANLCSMAETTNDRKTFRMLSTEGDKDERFLLVSPNFEVTLFMDRAKPREAFEVMLFGDPGRVEVMTNLKLSREEVWRGFELRGDIIKILRAHATRKLPENVTIYLKEWMESYKTVSLKMANVLFFKKREELDEMLLKYPDAFERIGPKTAIAEGEQTIKLLSEEGYVLRKSE